MVSTCSLHSASNGYKRDSWAPLFRYYLRWSVSFQESLFGVANSSGMVDWESRCRHPMSLIGASSPRASLLTALHVMGKRGDFQAKRQIETNGKYIKRRSGSPLERVAHSTIATMSARKYNPCELCEWIHLPCSKTWQLLLL